MSAKGIIPSTALKFFLSSGVANSGVLGPPSTGMGNTLNSAPFFVQSIDRIGIQLNAANNAGGTAPAGSFNIQGSLDYAQNAQGNVTNGGTFTSLTLSGSTTISAAGTTLVNVDAFGFTWIRVQWVPTSGDGVLTGFIAGRQI